MPAPGRPTGPATDAAGGPVTLGSVLAAQFGVRPMFDAGSAIVANVAQQRTANAAGDPRGNMRLPMGLGRRGA